MDRMDRISFVTDTGETESFRVLDEARLGGRSYLLVSDDGEEEGIAMVLRDDADPGSEESLYVPVEDEEELSAVLLLFEDTLEEMGILLEEE